MSIERGCQRVHLDDGRNLAYDLLLLATGARPRRLSLAGCELGGVHYLRTLADVAAIRRTLTARTRVVIVGGGYIGLETAATCRQAGAEVTVLEAADRVMNRVVCEKVSRFYESEHARHGVNVVLNAQVLGLRGDDRVRTVRRGDGLEHTADLVIVGVGVDPADELAVNAGLECRNGIVVDEHCRTSDPAIYAAGDCTNHPTARYGCRVRLESVDNAFEQAASAAQNMLGISAAHEKIPWFWSDQYDLKLLIVGLSQGFDRIVMRGDPGARSFSACYLRDGELIAIDTINSAKDSMAARRLIAARAKPDPARLANASLPLKGCV